MPFIRHQLQKFRKSEESEIDNFRRFRQISKTLIYQIIEMSHTYFGRF